MWRVREGAADDMQTFAIAKVFSETIGDGTTKDFVVTHNLNTRDITLALRLTNTPYSAVMTDWEPTTPDTVTVRFKKAPTSGQYRVTITG